jgi:hypothetical protein
MRTNGTYGSGWIGTPRELRFKDREGNFLLANIQVVLALDAFYPGFELVLDLSEVNLRQLRSGKATLAGERGYC